MKHPILNLPSLERLRGSLLIGLQPGGLPLQAAGVFAASYLLAQWLLPAVLTPPVAARQAAAAEPKAAAVIAVAVEEPALPPAAEVRTLEPLPRIVAVDRRIAERTEMLLPQVKKRLAHAAKGLPEGVTLLVTSAFRTREEQATLTPTFGLKARPGTSTHEHGRGIDLNVLVNGERISPREQQDVIGESMAKAGFQYLGAADPVHYSIPERELGPLPEEAPRLEVPTLAEVQDAQWAAAGREGEPMPGMAG